MALLDGGGVDSTHSHKKDIIRGICILVLYRILYRGIDTEISNKVNIAVGLGK